MLHLRECSTHPDMDGYDERRQSPIDLKDAMVEIFLVYPLHSPRFESPAQQW